MADRPQRRPEIWLGDYVDAIARLGLTDPEARRAVADLLGLPRLAAPAPEPPPPPAAPEQPPIDPMVDDVPDVDVKEPPAESAPKQGGGALVVTAEAPVLFTIPAWLDKKLAARTSTELAPLPFTPLLRREWTRAILGVLAAVWRAEHEIDIDRLVEEFARRRVVTALPRRRGQSLRLGTHIYVDDAGVMAWLASDVEMLLARARQVLGSEIRTIYVEHDPRDLPLPPAGTPVVIASDLGIAPLGATAMAATRLEISRSQAWRRAIEKLDRARCPIAILVPFPPQRWPAWVSRYPGVVMWDRRTTPAAVARVVRQDRHRR